MFKGYLAFGVIVLIMFANASMSGSRILDPFGIAPSKPQGPGQVHK